MARQYTLKKPPVDIATALTVPALKSERPRKIKLSEEEAKSLRIYITAKRSVERHKSTVLSLVERHGKLNYLEATVSPSTKATYEYSAELAAEIEAIDEKKKAARDSGDVETFYGSTSIKFADKKAKAKTKLKGGAK